MNVRVRGVVVGAVLGGFAVGSAQAQSANINATATVQQVLTVLAGSNLDFGAAFPGTTRTVDPKLDATAGRFDLTGQANAEVNLTLSRTPLAGPGGATLTLAFGAASGAHNTTNTAASATAFDPSAAATTRLDAATGQLYVFVGGSVSPATNQTAGAYTGTVTLAAAYTGN